MQQHPENQEEQFPTMFLPVPVPGLPAWDLPHDLGTCLDHFLDVKIVFSLETHPQTQHGLFRASGSGTVTVSDSSTASSSASSGKANLLPDYVSSLVRCVSQPQKASLAVPRNLLRTPSPLVRDHLQNAQGSWCDQWTHHQCG